VCPRYSLSAVSKYEKSSEGAQLQNWNHNGLSKLTATAVSLLQTCCKQQAVAENVQELAAATLERVYSVSELEKTDGWSPAHERVVCPECGVADPLAVRQCEEIAGRFCSTEMVKAVQSVVILVMPKKEIE